MPESPAPISSSPRAKVFSLSERREGAPRVEDARLVERILDGDAQAKAIFYDRYCRHVRGVIVRLLGHQVEVADLVHDVFVSALSDLPKLAKPSALKSWLTSIAVFRARRYIRTKSRRRWLSFLAPEEMPEETAVHADDVTREALAATYAVLETLPTDERIAFGLRFLAGMEVSEGAAASLVSESTFKRRVKRAREAFEAGASGVPALREWVGGAE